MNERRKKSEPVVYNVHGLVREEVSSSSNPISAWSVQREERPGKSRWVRDGRETSTSVWVAFIFRLTLVSDYSRGFYIHRGMSFSAVSEARAARRRCQLLCKPVA